MSRRERTESSFSANNPELLLPLCLEVSGLLPAGADGCSLLVRNLSRSVTIDDLRYVAEKYGRLRDVYIPKDYYSGWASFGSF